MVVLNNDNGEELDLQGSTYFLRDGGAYLFSIQIRRQTFGVHRSIGGWRSVGYLVSVLSAGVL